MSARLNSLFSETKKCIFHYNNFAGVTLDSGKRYTQTVEKSFHLSMAALGFQNCSSTPVTVMVEVDKAQFALCTLQPGKIPQQPLDYCFTEGEEITFFTEGPGDVHLTGLHLLLTFST